MTEIEKLIETLVTCGSKSHALIEIGEALNRLRQQSKYDDTQLENFLNELKGRLENRRTGTERLEHVIAGLEQFRPVFHQTPPVAS